MPTLASNKKAFFDYEILEKFEAGLALKGFEVKAIKTGHISIKGAFVTVKGKELFLTNAKIPLYQHTGKIESYEETAPRKLLLKKNEINRLIGKVKIEGLTLIPISVYNKRKLIKLEFALAKGKKKYDKRQTIKKRDADREIARQMKIRD